MKHRPAAVTLLLLVLFVPVLSAEEPTAGKPEEEADALMGDWHGVWGGDGPQGRIVAQVIAEGHGNYRAVILDEFDRPNAPFVVLEGKLTDGEVAFDGKADADKEKFAGTKWTATIEDGWFVGEFEGNVTGFFEMKKVRRLSSTLGARPPSGAVVLFDGTNLDQWQHPDGGTCRWKLTEGAMAVTPSGSIISRRRFADQRVHIEFRTPFMPEARGQGRGNSGVYLQGRCEVQVLDSYGLAAGGPRECGAIYSVAGPTVNMCAPPMQWQTYDITFYAPRFGENGKKATNARMTVIHNGVKIHDNVEVPGPTVGHGDEHLREPGGLYLQDHGNPVQYRNIWVVELAGKDQVGKP